MRGRHKKLLAATITFNIQSNFHVKYLDLCSCENRFPMHFVDLAQVIRENLHLLSVFWEERVYRITELLCYFVNSHQATTTTPPPPPRPQNHTDLPSTDILNMAHHFIIGLRRVKVYPLEFHQARVGNPDGIAIRRALAKPRENEWEGERVRGEEEEGVTNRAWD